MAIDVVKKYFKQYNRDQDILEFSTSSATVLMAANALNTQSARIAKTLAFKYEDTCLLVVTSGDTKIDNSKFKKEFGIKASMLSAEQVLNLTGHAVGGVCPFALVNKDIKVFTDLSLNRFKTSFPACGSSNSAIELSPEELFNYSNSIKWIDVCNFLAEN